jgi:hypothetical protein
MRIQFRNEEALIGLFQPQSRHTATHGMDRLAAHRFSSAGQWSRYASGTDLERWRATRGLPDGGDPMAAYVGHSREDPAGQARVVINVDAADALLFAEMISYLIASRPLGHPGVSSGPWPSGHGMGNAQPSAGHCCRDHEFDGQVSSQYRASSRRGISASRHPIPLKRSARSCAGRRGRPRCLHSAGRRSGRTAD